MPQNEPPGGRCCRRRRRGVCCGAGATPSLNCHRGQPRSLGFEPPPPPLLLPPLPAPRPHVHRFLRADRRQQVSVHGVPFHDRWPGRRGPRSGRAPGGERQGPQEHAPVHARLGLRRRRRRRRRRRPQEQRQPRLRGSHCRPQDLGDPGKVVGSRSRSRSRSSFVVGGRGELQPRWVPCGRYALVRRIGSRQRPVARHRAGNTGSTGIACRNTRQNGGGRPWSSCRR